MTFCFRESKSQFSVFQFGFGVDAGVGVAIDAATADRGCADLRAEFSGYANDRFRSSSRFGERTNGLSDELVFGFLVHVNRCRGTFQLRGRV